MEEGRFYQWYVEPTDKEYTNEVISRHQDFITEVEHCLGVVCADGVARDLWGCDSGFVTLLRNHRASLGLSYTVWCRTGNGKIRRMERFEHKKPKTYSVSRLPPIMKAVRFG
ncbi:MAG: hypothetical protein WCO10_03675 [bacterium]